MTEGLRMRPEGVLHQLLALERPRLPGGGLDQLSLFDAQEGLS